MAQDAPRRRRARPVADAPVDGLLARGEEIAKGWVLALVEDAPLDAAPALLGAGVVRDGPRLCDAAARALATDTALAGLSAGGSLRGLAASVGAMTGSAGAAGAARAVDALAQVLWAAVEDELRGPAPDLVTALAERVALVCAVIRDAAIEGCGDAWPGNAGPAVGAGDASGAGGRPAGAATDLPGVDGEPAEWLWDGVAESPAAIPGSGGDAGDEAPLWMSVLGDEVRGSGGEGRPLSLLLAELEDAERVIASATPERAGLAFGDFVGALRGVLRRDDILVCEADGRAWVIARGTARPAAHSLGARIAEAVGQSSALSGAPLVASVGVAVLGEDGSSGEELIEAAEEARFSASARGIEVSRRLPDQDRPA